MVSNYILLGDLLLSAFFCERIFSKAVKNSQSVQSRSILMLKEFYSFRVRLVCHVMEEPMFINKHSP
ncbi:hypothetical protein BpHYR1_025734 [Brachionus plicatilis]|uniref:Uncharacterized protein n=1 Tax=Brachionus plicatilis TaxID=10195 RepID=A0A3M7RL05_BRAPC|nr:hypothetical protein BpHYR1_025734 [Brachionus plicatilis]